MDVKEFFRITKEKIIISLFLVLYFYFSNSFFEISIHLHQIIARDIIGLATWNVYKMNTSFVLLLKIVYGVINWLFNILVYYLFTCAIMFGYNVFRSKYPKIKTFFELTTEKYKLIGILFVLFVIFSLLSAAFRFGFLGITFGILSLLLGLDDQTIIHRLYHGIGWTYLSTKVHVFILSTGWWYLLSSVILYFKNRKKLE